MAPKQHARSVIKDGDFHAKVSNATVTISLLLLLTNISTKMRASVTTTLSNCTDLNRSSCKRQVSLDRLNVTPC